MKLSVCIATYNGEKYIIDQLHSILSQLGEHDEVIISDDSSTDRTVEIIESLHDKRIRIYKDRQFKSPVFNFEHALQQCSGDIIFLSDQDDVWVQGKVKIMTAALDRFDLAVCDCYITDASLNIIRESMFSINRSGTGIVRNTIKNGYLGCCMAFKRRILARVLPFPPDTPMHDIWIGMVADAFYKVTFIPEKLVYYRRHDANSVQWKEGIKSVYTIRQKLAFRFTVLRNLIRRSLKK